MAHLDGNAWVFDSLVGFLHGPVWNVPLQTFIEEKSLPFEPTDNGEVLDRPEYKQIHDDYRNLVDVMLGSFMDDIGISADQFEAACKLSARDLAGLPAHFHRRLFEQIWAANDYEMFVKMMTHKNVELQLQALELIERRYGTMAHLFSAESENLDTSRSDESEDWPDKDDVMTEIKKLQLEDFGGKDEVVNVPPEEVVAEKQTLLSKLHSFEKKEENHIFEKKEENHIFEKKEENHIFEKKEENHIFEKKEENHIFEKKEENHIFEKEDFDIKDRIVAEAKKIQVMEPPKPPPKKVEVSEEEMLARQEYLKQQRDKLLALKKQVRERRLGAVDGAESGGGEGSQGSVARPRSARAAQAALAGVTSTPPPDAMQLRRALASKLKTEVVDIAN